MDIKHIITYPCVKSGITNAEHNQNSYICKAYDQDSPCGIYYSYQVTRPKKSSMHACKLYMLSLMSSGLHYHYRYSAGSLAQLARPKHCCIQVWLCWTIATLLQLQAVIYTHMTALKFASAIVAIAAITQIQAETIYAQCCLCT